MNTVQLHKKYYSVNPNCSYHLKSKLKLPNLLFQGLEKSSIEYS